MTDRERRALEAAACGLVSGVLGEWPVLRSALRQALGADLAPTLGAAAMRMLAQEALAAQARHGEAPGLPRPGTLGL